MADTSFIGSPAAADDEEAGVVARPSRRRSRSATGSSRTDNAGNGVGNAIQISAKQRMLAACSGSLLTSLLVTPLDVVRVRLQSQHQPPANSQTFPKGQIPNSKDALRAHRMPLSPLQFSHSFSRLPPELGVTACCREVFWLSNESEYCLANDVVVKKPGAAGFALEEISCAAEETSRRTFRGTWEGLVKIARYEGATSLWRGLTPTLVMAIPGNVIYFTGYDALREIPWVTQTFGPVAAPLLAGAAARTFAATAISPLELFRTRLQAVAAPKRPISGSSLGVFRQTLRGLGEMVSTQGFSSLWRGLTLTLWRDVPFSGLYWSGYELSKNLLSKRRPEMNAGVGPMEISFTDSFLSGAASGTVAAFLTTPFDVGKTRQQVEARVGDVPQASRALNAPTNVVETMPRFLYNIYREEGIRGLWRGCTPRILKVAPACAIMISSYEAGKKWAKRSNERNEIA